MASSNGNPELLGSTHTAQPNLSTKHTEDLTSAASQTSTLREKRHSDRPKGRKTPAAGSWDGWVQEVVGLHNEQCPQLPLSVICLKWLVNVEMELVHGDEQDITHKSPASTYSQLMCHSSETTGSPSGPNLASLPPIDKRLDTALQDADRYYRLKKYTTAARWFTIALQVLTSPDIYISMNPGPYKLQHYLLILITPPQGKTIWIQVIVKCWKRRERERDSFSNNMASRLTAYSHKF